MEFRKRKRSRDDEKRLSKKKKGDEEIEDEEIESAEEEAEEAVEEAVGEAEEATEASGKEGEKDDDPPGNENEDDEEGGKGRISRFKSSRHGKPGKLKSHFSKKEDKKEEEKDKPQKGPVDKKEDKPEFTATQKDMTFNPFDDVSESKIIPPPGSANQTVISEPAPFPEPASGEPAPPSAEDLSATLISATAAKPMDLVKEEYMQRALDLALQGRGLTSPNPMVGAVVVKEGKILAESYHTRFGGPHAEAGALLRAGAAAKGATLYVTLEPCNHFGKTPPCTKHIIASGISRVVVATRDPNPNVKGGGLDTLEAAGISVTVGLLEEDARKINAPYFNVMATGYPFLVAKWAMSVDGKTATLIGDSKWISCEDSRLVVHQLRGYTDAVVVGVGTIIKDNSVLTSHDLGPKDPKRVILDTNLRIPLESAVLRSTEKSEVIIVTTEKASEDKMLKLSDMGCKILKVSQASGKVHFREAMKALVEEGIHSCLLEGGEGVLGSAFDSGLVKHIMVFVAPIIMGGKKAFGAIGGIGVPFVKKALRVENFTYTVCGEDLLLEGDIAKNE